MKHFTLPLLALAIVGILLALLPQERQEATPPYSKETLRKKKMKGFEGPRQFFDYHKSLKTRTGDSGPRYNSNYREQALQKAKSKLNSKSSKKLDWIERGPSNVSGRTRSIYVDPRDISHNTWLVGSVGGGVWRTRDAGETWTHLTSDLASLATSTLACSAANPGIIYVGTGEGISGSGPQNGSGIFKSSDDGNSFEILAFTQNNEKFGAVTRLAISQLDPNVVYASTMKSIYNYEISQNSINRETDSYIFKTIDGGTTWEELLTTKANPFQQILLDPVDEQVVYATANGLGIYKSSNGGEDWELSFDLNDKMISRIEMAIAPTDRQILYASCEASEMGDPESILFKSIDGGGEWLEVEGKNLSLSSWLGAQGFYNNTIAVHPYNEHIVFLGGQLQMLEVNTDVGSVEGLGVSFTQDLLVLEEVDGTMQIAENVANFFGTTTDLMESDLESLAISINQGMTNAFRYSGEFEYLDQTPIPVIATNPQGEELALTYADFNENGIWDYDEDFQMETIIIYKHPADDMLTNSITTGNVFGQAMYLFTPTFIEEFNVTDLPEETLMLELATLELPLGEVLPISDFVFEFQDQFPDAGPNNIHPDHHFLVIVPIDAASGAYYILNANDGGIAFSNDNGKSFRQTGISGPRLIDVNEDNLTGYNTSQFYGVDKMNGADRYLGGTQDNGVWLSPENPDENSEWDLAPSGDGFETAWHYTNPNWLLQTSQLNELRKSIDGGISWDVVKLPQNTGPFITRLASSKQEPDFVCMVCAEGILRSYDFGETWDLVPLGSPEQVFQGPNSPTEISLASPRVVWTGADLEHLYVSDDGAYTFKEAKGYDPAILGSITSINTHPYNPRKAYITYSIADGPKILMTENLGESWTDISGFTTHNTPESNNGFPNVPTTSLLVMPYDTTILWAGTEIGIFESTDSGASWHYADSGLPAVNIWEMKIVNDEVIIASHGRGIWTVGLPELEGHEPIASTPFPKISVDYSFANRFEGTIELLSAFDSSKVVLELMDGRKETVAVYSSNTIPVNESFSYASLLAIEEVETARLRLLAFKRGEVYNVLTDIHIYEVMEQPVATYTNDFENDLSSFAKLGFEEKFLPELNTQGLQTNHPYNREFDYFSIMRQPLVVENISEQLTFDEIVLVEPGAEINPESELFFDHVSVSATKDFGRSWVSLAKYDSNEQSAWLSNFESTVIAPDLVYAKAIDLGQDFEIGDTLYFRFELVSDFNVEGWGWYVDNLVYGRSSGTDNLVPNIANLELFPNPAEEQVTISFHLDMTAPVNLSITDMLGRLVLEEKAGSFSKGKHNLPISIDNLSAGNYIFQLSAGTYSETIKFSKI